MWGAAGMPWHIRPTRSCSLSCCIYFVVKHNFWASYLSFSCLLLPWDSVQALVWHMCGPQPRPSHKIWRNTQTHPQMSQLPETHQHSIAETQIWIPLSIPGLSVAKDLLKSCNDGYWQWMERIIRQWSWSFSGLSWVRLWRGFGPHPVTYSVYPNRVPYCSHDVP